jgi:hypothetical protein
LALAGISGDISFDFLLPEFDIRSGQSKISAIVMPMPEASVNKDRGPVPWQNDVRSAG